MGQKGLQQTRPVLGGMRIRAARSKIILFFFKNNGLAKREKTPQVKVANNNIYLEQSIQQHQQQHQQQQQHKAFKVTRSEASMPPIPPRVG